MHQNQRFNLFVESIKACALPVEELSTHLPEFVIVQDEVFSIFENAYLISPQLIDEGLIPPTAVSSLIRAQIAFDFALRNQIPLPESGEVNKWERGRKACEVILNKMGISDSTPNLSFLSYQKG